MSWTINGTPLSGQSTKPAEFISTHLDTLTVLRVCNYSTAIDKDPRRTVTADTSLILREVIFGDTAIYQCLASNKHGTILTNTYVYVIGELFFFSRANTLSVFESVFVVKPACFVSELPPQILTEDRKRYSVTEGQKVSLDCETFGSPKPKVVW